MNNDGEIMKNYVIADEFLRTEISKFTNCELPSALKEKGNKKKIRYMTSEQAFELQSKIIKLHHLCKSLVLDDLNNNKGQFSEDIEERKRTFEFDNLIIALNHLNDHCILEILQGEGLISIDNFNTEGFKEIYKNTLIPQTKEYVINKLLEIKSNVNKIN